MCWVLLQILFGAGAGPPRVPQVCGVSEVSLFSGEMAVGVGEQSPPQARAGAAIPSFPCKMGTKFTSEQPNSRVWDGEFGQIETALPGMGQKQSPEGLGCDAQAAVVPWHPQGHPKAGAAREQRQDPSL